MAGAAPIIGALTGVAGLLQAGNAQHEQSNYQHQALKAQQPQIAAQRDVRSAGVAYDPAQQDRLAFSGANQNASAALSQALGAGQGSFLSGGGQPTGDTAFNLASQGAANRIMDPLRSWSANQIATEPQRKSEALASVFRAPAGQISNAYFDAANMAGPRTDMGGSIGSLIKSLQMLPGFGGGATGGGYHGAGPGGGTFPNMNPGEGLPGSTQGPGGASEWPNDSWWWNPNLGGAFAGL